MDDLNDQVFKYALKLCVFLLQPLMCSYGGNFVLLLGQIKSIQKDKKYIQRTKNLCTHHNGNAKSAASF